MHTGHTSSHRKGVSTIMGVLIFIGILFSAVVPMFLVMQQADTILEQKKLEIRRVDEERVFETMDMFAYPVVGESKLEIKVNNRCELPISIVHLWINDTEQDVDILVLPMESDKILGQYNVTVEPGINSEFNVRMTTGRGNFYESQAGLIIYDGTEGWHTETLRIVVFIGVEQGGRWWRRYGNYRTTVWNEEGTYNETDTISWSTGTCMFSFDVTEYGPDTYHVWVERRTGGWWSSSWETLYDEDVEFIWPGGSPVLEIYID